MFVPQKIENNLVFIDISNLCIFNIPTKLVTQIIEVHLLFILFFLIRV